MGEMRNTDIILREKPIGKHQLEDKEGNGRITLMWLLRWNISGSQKLYSNKHCII
jgi:hypothetical protein